MKENIKETIIKYKYYGNTGSEFAYYCSVLYEEMAEKFLEDTGKFI